MTDDSGLGTDGFDTDWLADFEGLAPEEALLLAQDQGRTVRVIGPRDAVTMDFRPQRLNIFVDDDGVLIRYTAS